MAWENMKSMGFIPTLEETLEELKMTRNALSVESKVRPGTVNEIFKGDAKQVNFQTLAAIIDTLNRAGFEKGTSRKFTVEDVFKYDARTKKSAE
ncbi:helix-turn-helix domain-containing protein [Sutcliffiella horikoshii]|uniref:helix-turn-helix domain-containing protein n=1 Tax=Sutcliffiella horikoshii TaxID=79883 RepID=UPI00384E8E93